MQRIVSAVLTAAAIMPMSGAATAESPAPASSETHSVREVTLWPGGEPPLSTESEPDHPRLIVQTVASETPTAAMVIVPGGGYGGLAIGHEGHEIAQWLARHGIATAICVYRTRGRGGNGGAGYGHPAPMNDAHRAIATVRANADQWNVDPGRIGVIGFSAGGHLVSTICTRVREPDPKSDDPVRRASAKPNLAIVAYPVITMDQPYTHGGSVRNLLGKDPSKDQLVAMSNERHVTADTPPTFLFHTVEDQAVDVRNSLDYARGLSDAGVPFEMHIFPEGRHGVGLAADVEGPKQWPSLAIDWLRRQGFVDR